MRYPITLDSLENGLNYYFQVKKKGAIFKIILIKFNLYGNSQLISAIDLRWLRKAGCQNIYPVSSPPSPSL
jgi:hypothetical protein